MATKYSICSVCDVTYNTTEIGDQRDIYSHGYCPPHAAEARVQMDRDFEEMKRAGFSFGFRPAAAGDRHGPADGLERAA